MAGATGNMRGLSDPLGALMGPLYNGMGGGEGKGGAGLAAGRSERRKIRFSRLGVVLGTAGGMRESTGR